MKQYKDILFDIKLRAQQLAESERKSFPGRKLPPKLTKSLSDFQEILRDLSKRIDVENRYITILGAKNTGKSWLCQLFINNSEALKKIRVGLGKKNNTKKITWIGPDFPTNIDLKHEETVFVASEDLPQRQDSGAYVLLDIPAYNDNNEATHQATTRIASARAAIAVASLDVLEDESLLQYLSQLDKVPILPVIVVPEMTSATAPGIVAFQASIRRHCPNSDVVTPVVVPKIDNIANPDARHHAEQKAKRSILHRFSELHIKGIEDIGTLAEAQFKTFQKQFESNGTKIQRNKISKITVSSKPHPLEEAQKPPLHTKNAKTPPASSESHLISHTQKNMQATSPSSNTLENSSTDSIHPVLENIQQRAERLEDAIHRVFQNSEIHTKLAGKFTDLRSNLSELTGRTGVEAPAIAIIGAKNSGKSWLCRLLLNDTEAMSKIRVGFGNENATEKITWIGPERPLDLHPEYEEAIFVTAKDLPESSAPYVLLDVPGYNDNGDAARYASTRTASARAAVAVASLDVLEDESLVRYLRQLDGVPILPVVVIPEKSSAQSPCIEAFRAAIRRHCPKSDIAKPVVIPKIDNITDSDARNRAEREAKRKITESFSRLPASETTDIGALAEARYENFLMQLSAELKDFLDDVGDAHYNLLQREQKAASEIVESILGTDDQISMVIRLRMLLTTARSMPVLYFPFRPFFAGLSMASGAIDRLLLGLAGSIPSLAMAVYQTARNAASLKGAPPASNKWLAQRATRIAREKLAEPTVRFRRTVARSLLLDPSKELDVAGNAKIEIEGLDDLEASSAEIFAENISKHHPSSTVPKRLGALATGIFALLALGPICSIYRGFCAAWVGGFSLENTTNWQAFPAPSHTMIFTTTLLVFAPVVFFALIAVGLSVSHDDINNCKNNIRTDHQKLTSSSSCGNSLLRIKSTTPIQSAVRTILDACAQVRRKPRPPQ